MGSIINRGTKADPKWYVKYRDADGRQKMANSYATSKEKAKQFLRLAEENVANGRVGVEKRGEEKTFAELAAHWLEVHSATLESHADNVGRMEHLTKALGKLPVSGVTAETVALLRARMAAETVPNGKGKKVQRWRPSTVNRVLALLRKVLNDGVSWGWARSAPKVKLLPVPETAFDFLKREEAERFLSHVAVAAPNDAALYTTAIYTGARMGEIWGLRWADLDLARGLITVRRNYDRDFTKSKKIRHVRINKQLGGVLKGWRRVCPKGDLELVFPKPDGTMRARERPPEGFEKRLAEARCHKIRFHDLRHTAASLLVMAGVSLRAVQTMLGHSTIQVTEKYAHLAPDFQEREADRLKLDVQIGLGGLVVLRGEG
jgi:integrase